MLKESRNSSKQLVEPSRSLKVMAYLGSFLVWLMMQLLFLTCRKRVFGQEVWHKLSRQHHGKILGAGWHRGIIYICFHFRNINGTIMSSRSRDGEWMTQVLHRFGYFTPRGSSGQNKGGHQALDEFVNHVIEGWPGGIAVDAPKGPAYVSKHGVIVAAARTGAPICPFGWYAESNKRINSWDRTIVPKPFSKLVAVFSREPIYVPPDATREQLEEYRQLLDLHLLRLMYQTDHWFELQDKYPDPRDIPVPDTVPGPDFSQT
ncbi:lysophospholipid acyltransferase family protein [candidate division CSSED10-310 bacterium]|uniref:Lysophospholipid acyltransferase family protein n=1 Tax=candidate division CSSED10-310 bacterium TaxID=2855610 RepID=A0ABV6Z6G2_UNCC1